MRALLAEMNGESSSKLAIDDAIDDAQFFRVVLALTKHRKCSVDIAINSDGGEVASAFRIFNRLRSHPGPKRVFIAGRCFSAAVIIAMAGGLRIARSDSRFLLHPSALPQTAFPEWTAANCRTSAARLQDADRRILDLLVSRSTAKRNRLRSLIEQGTEFGAETALHLGLIDRIDRARANV